MNKNVYPKTEHQKYKDLIKKLKEKISELTKQNREYKQQLERFNNNEHKLSKIEKNKPQKIKPIKLTPEEEKEAVRKKWADWNKQRGNKAENQDN